MKLFRYSTSIFNNVLHRINTIVIPVIVIGIMFDIFIFMFKNN